MRKALFIIGCNYRGQTRIGGLSVGNDLVAVGGFFHRVAGFDRVETVIDENADQVVAKLDAVLKHLAAGDLLVIYFGGHGVQTAEHMLVMPAGPEANSGAGHELLPVSRLRRIVTAGGIRLGMILDCCRNASAEKSRGPLQDVGFVRGLTSSSTTRNIGIETGRPKTATPPPAASVAILSACAPDEWAPELGDTGRGLFSTALLAVMEVAKETGDSVRLDGRFRQRVEAEMNRLADLHGVSLKPKPYFEGNENPEILTARPVSKAAGPIEPDDPPVQGYFLIQDGRRLELGGTEVAQRIGSGSITRATPMCKRGRFLWATAGSFAELIPEFDRRLFAESAKPVEADIRPVDTKTPAPAEIPPELFSETRAERFNGPAKISETFPAAAPADLSSPIVALACSASGAVVRASAGGRLLVSSLTASSRRCGWVLVGRMSTTGDADRFCCDISRDGKRLVAISRDGSILRVNLETGKAITHAGDRRGSGRPIAARFVTGGRQWDMIGVWASQPPMRFAADDDTAALQRIALGDPLENVNQVAGVSLSGNGRLAAVDTMAGADRTIYIHDIDRRFATRVHKLGNDDAGANAVAFDRDRFVTLCGSKRSVVGLGAGASTDVLAEDCGSRLEQVTATDRFWAGVDPRVRAVRVISRAGAVRVAEIQDLSVIAACGRDDVLFFGTEGGRFGSIDLADDESPLEPRILG